MTKVIALVGKAGSGKDTIMKQVLAAAPGRLHEIVSCTTRPKREGETNGVNYHFLSDNEFEKQVTNEEFIEHTEFNNWLYGTRFKDLNNSMINIGVFNPAGATSLYKNKDIDLTAYYIVCDNKERMLRQLNREEDPNVAEIARRFFADEKDFKHLEFPYICLPNRTLEEMQTNVEWILSQSRVSNVRTK